jgi:wyosine [tRNA(Phe)-imidazoG37] synthetase (radical SAM superfamily)
MSTFLFDSIIFGPVWSRRLGESLGINLLPVNRKVCNFNCVYCECGLTPSGSQASEFPDKGEVAKLLELRLREMKENGEYLDSITFAGNGEPTLHPGFPQILDDAIAIRNLSFPDAAIAVLSNATLIGKDTIFRALLKADLNILKLDSAVEDTLAKINCPKGNFRLTEILHLMRLFNGKMIIQTLFFRGRFNGINVDNTTENEVKAWLAALEQVRPESVMIYSIARDTAVQGLERISQGELEEIAGRVEKIGINAQVTP